MQFWLFDVVLEKMNYEKLYDNDTNFNVMGTAAVAQWVRALASQAEGCVRIPAATDLVVN